MTEQVLAVVVAFFVVWLAVRMIWSLVSNRRIDLAQREVDAPVDAELASIVESARESKARDGIRAITRRAQVLPNSASRSAHLCAAGDLALTEMKRPGLAGGLYLRALREDPTCLDSLHHLRQVLVAQKSQRRLERAYWDVLGRLENTEEHREAWVLCWQGLASLSAASPRTVRRADAIRKTLQAFGVVSDDDDSITES